MAGASQDTRFALSRRAKRSLLLLFALAFPAYLVTPYLAVPFIIAAILIMRSGRPDGRTDAGGG